MLPPRFLNVETADVPTEVHRIMPVSRLVELLTQNRNTLVYPPIWNDPYEAVELRTQQAYPLFKDSADGAIKVGRPFVGEPIRAGTLVYGTPAEYQYYCQSWSAADESETMWRAYSPNSDSVRISISANALLDQSSLALPDYAIYFGKVTYWPRNVIESLASDGQANRRLQGGRVREGEPWGRSWALSLLKKRDAFRHEEEFRLIAIRGQSLMSTKIRADLLQHEIDPLSLLSRVQIDPRCTKSDEIISEVRHVGFWGEITKSSLFEPPNLHVWNSSHPRDWKP